MWIAQFSTTCEVRVVNRMGTLPCARTVLASTVPGSAKVPPSSTFILKSGSHHAVFPSYSSTTARKTSSGVASMTASSVTSYCLDRHTRTASVPPLSAIPPTSNPSLIRIRITPTVAWRLTRSVRHRTCSGARGQVQFSAGTSLATARASPPLLESPTHRSNNAKTCSN